MQALPRKAGFAYGRNGEALRGSEELRYRRNGTSNLHAALERATGKIFTKATEACEEG